MRCSGPERRSDQSFSYLDRRVLAAQGPFEWKISTTGVGESYLRDTQTIFFPLVISWLLEKSPVSRPVEVELSLGTWIRHPVNKKSLWYILYIYNKHCLLTSSHSPLIRWRKKFDKFDPKSPFYCLETSLPNVLPLVAIKVLKISEYS